MSAFRAARCLIGAIMKARQKTRANKRKAKRAAKERGRRARANR